MYSDRGDSDYAVRPGWGISVTGAEPGMVSTQQDVNGKELLIWTNQWCFSLCQDVLALLSPCKHQFCWRTTSNPTTSWRCCQRTPKPESAHSMCRKPISDIEVAEERRYLFAKCRARSWTAIV